MHGGRARAAEKIDGQAIEARSRDKDASNAGTLGAWGSGITLFDDPVARIGAARLPSVRSVVSFRDFVRASAVRAAEEPSWSELGRSVSFAGMPYENATNGLHVAWSVDRCTDGHELYEAPGNRHRSDRQPM